MNLFLRHKTAHKTQKKIFAGMLLSFLIFAFYPLSTRAYIVDSGEINKEISDEGVTFTYNEVEDVIVLADEEETTPTDPTEPIDPTEPTTTIITGGGSGGGKYDASNWILEQKYDELVALRDEDWTVTHAAPPKEFDPQDLETVLLIPGEVHDISEEVSSPTFVEVENISSRVPNIKTVSDTVNIKPNWVENFFTPIKLSFSASTEPRDGMECVFVSQNNLLVLKRQIQIIQDLVCMFTIIIFFLLFSQLITFIILRKQYKDITDKCDKKKTIKKNTKTVQKKTTKTRRFKNLLLLLVLSLIPVLIVPVAQANTFDTEKVYYQGILKDDLGNRLNGSYDFRFSVWLTEDFLSGEVVGGEIVTTSPQYLDWQEFQTEDITNGDFLFRIGEILVLPTDLFVDHYVYLQVEVKETAQANTEYEIIDIDGADPLVDRLNFFDPVPFARNTDTLDFHSAGFTNGDIPYLDVDGLLPESTIPGGTNADTFTLDADGTALATDTLSLTFGSTLAKTISWNGLAGQFEFNDNVAISGDMIVLGTINGVTVGERDITDTLSPTYERSVFIPDGTDNIGSMHEEDDNQKNIIRWTTEEVALNDYDLQVRYTLPSDFEEFAGVNDFSLAIKTDGLVTESTVDVSLNKEGDAITEQLTGTNTGIVSNTWTTHDFSLIPTTTWVAGEVLVFKIKLHASIAKDVRLGDLKINYTIN